jgi:hypothetical protein
MPTPTHSAFGITGVFIGKVVVIAVALLLTCPAFAATGGINNAWQTLVDATKK